MSQYVAWNGKNEATHDDRPQNFVPNIEVVMREAAPLMSEDAVIRILRRILRHADPEGPPLFHALEDEIDPVSLLIDQAAQTRQDVILLAHALFRPFDGNLMIAGKSLDPVLIISGPLTQYFLADHRDREHVPEEVDHLLRSRQSAEIAVYDDAVEAMIYKNQKITEELREQVH